MLNDENFSNIAYEISRASKCVSRHTGAVIVNDGRIISTGYNGTPKGYCNCSEHFSEGYTEKHHEWSYKYEIHAEMNAIAWAARRGVSTEGATIYCTYEPCFDCSRAIIASGIKEIVFTEKYKHHKQEGELEEFLNKCGVVLRKIQ